MHVLDLNTHTAYLDPVTGEGWLILPMPADDLSLDGVSLHGAAELAALRHLEGLGFVLSEDDQGQPMQVGYTSEGREVVGLFGLSPLCDMPSMQQQAEVFAGFTELVGPLSRVPGQRQCI